MNRNLVRHQGNVRDLLNTALPMGLVRDGKLSAITKAVALEVWSHAEGRHQSASSVADALGINRKTVYPALAELEERGWLVREVHHKISEKGNRVWDREVWHLRMTNAPFTEEQTLSLKRTGVCPPDGQVPVHGTDTVEVKGRSAPEVHSDHRSEEEPVRPTDRSGEDDPQRESEPDWESVSSSPQCYSTTHRFRGATDPFASQSPSDSSAQVGSVRGEPEPVNPEEYREDGMLSLVQSVTAVSDEPKPWESGPVAECARQVWPKGRPWPPEPGTFDPFVTYVDAETGEPLSR